MLLGVSRQSLVSLDHSFILSWWWWWWWGWCWCGCCCNYFSMPLFGDFFPTLYKRLKHNKGEDFIWAALAPCPILLVRETIFFYSLTRLKWLKYAIVIYHVYMYSHSWPIKYFKIKIKIKFHFQILDYIALTSKSQPNISIYTKFKLKILTKPSFRIFTKIQIHYLYKTSAEKTDQTPASNLAFTSTSKSWPNLVL